MTRETLLALADRLEQATGTDRELDGEIAKAVSPDRDWHEFRECWMARSLEDTGAFDFTLVYTASLDAAMTLVPEGRMWIGGHSPSTASAMTVCQDRQTDGQLAKAKTPALALCAAALRARAAMEEA